MSDHDKESILAYIKRMLHNDNLYNRKDFSLHEFIPFNMQKFNAEIETQGHTYYFSISSSIRGRHIKTKNKDIISEPKKTSAMAT